MTKPRKLAERWNLYATSQKEGTTGFCRNITKGSRDIYLGFISFGVFRGWWICSSSILTHDVLLTLFIINENVVQNIFQLWPGWQLFGRFRAKECGKMREIVRFFCKSDTKCISIETMLYMFFIRTTKFRLRLDFLIISPNWASMFKTLLLDCPLIDIEITRWNSFIHS